MDNRGSGSSRPHRFSGFNFNKKQSVLSKLRLPSLNLMPELALAGGIADDLDGGTFGYIRRKEVRSAVGETRQSHSVPYFLLATTLLTFVVITVGSHFSFNSKTPRVSNYDYRSGDSARTLAMLDRQTPLAKMSLEKKRQFTGQVKYVLDIINTSNKKSENARLLAQSIVLESNKANYDPLLVAAVVKSESTFNHTAISKVGAKGLMQIMPSTGEFISKNIGNGPWAGTHKLEDPEYNLKLGIAYLKRLETQFRGNREHALIAYNWGPANLQRALKNNSSIPGSTVEYARKIINTHQRWKSDFSARGALAAKAQKVGMVA